MTNSVQAGSPLVQISADWGQELLAGVCASCGWNFLLTTRGQLRRCPYCFQAELSPFEPGREALPGTNPPELVVPGELARQKLEQSLFAFSQGIWFAPQDLNPSNLVQRIERVYLPMWLVDVQVEATWQAEAGYDYQVVSHREQYDQNRGGWITQEVTETRVRWEPRAGKLRRAYQNNVAPALEEHAQILSRIGEFDLDKGQPYTADLVAGWQVRLPDRSQEDAWPMAAPAIQTSAALDCRRAMSANHIRQYLWSPEFTEQNWTLQLLPMLTTFYLDDENRPQTILINGQTGRLSGVRRASMKRAQRLSLYILLAALAVFLIGVVLALAGFIFPPAVAIGGIGIVLASIVAVSAALPLGWVWSFNRKQK